jgi:hypothetical protein
VGLTRLALLLMQLAREKDLSAGRLVVKQAKGGSDTDRKAARDGFVAKLKKDTISNQVERGGGEDSHAHEREREREVLLLLLLLLLSSPSSSKSSSSSSSF